MSSAYTAIVFGKGRVAIRAAEILIAHGARLLLVVPSRGSGSGQPDLATWASEVGIEVAATSDMDRLDGYSADLGLSVYFDQIFRERHIARFHRLLNVHNSVLPRHRGVRPVNWALRMKDSMHGVTLHEVDAGVDTGPVIAQETFPIDPDQDEVIDVYERCLEAATVLLERTLPRVLTLGATPQPEELAVSHRASDDHLLGDRRYWRRGDVGLEPV